MSGEQLAMLEGAEYIVFDPEHPQGALTTMTAPLHKMQANKLAAAQAAKQAEMQAAMRREQELTIAMGLICVLLILYIATSNGGAASSA